MGNTIKKTLILLSIIFMLTGCSRSIEITGTSVIDETETQYGLKV